MLSLFFSLLFFIAWFQQIMLISQPLFRWIFDTLSRDTSIGRRPVDCFSGDLAEEVGQTDWVIIIQCVLRFVAAVGEEADGLELRIDPVGLIFCLFVRHIKWRSQGGYVICLLLSVAGPELLSRLLDRLVHFVWLFSWLFLVRHASSALLERLKVIWPGKC